VGECILAMQLSPSASYWGRVGEELMEECMLSMQPLADAVLLGELVDLNGTSVGTEKRDLYLGISKFFCKSMTLWRYRMVLTSPRCRYVMTTISLSPLPSVSPGHLQTNPRVPIQKPAQVHPRMPPRVPPKMHPSCFSQQLYLRLPNNSHNNKTSSKRMVTHTPTT
jgi:hypothetical protein